MSKIGIGRREEPVPNWIGYGFAGENNDQYGPLLCDDGRVNKNQNPQKNSYSLKTIAVQT